MGTDGWRRAEKSRNGFRGATALLTFVAAVTFVLLIVVSFIPGVDNSAFLAIPFGSAALAGLSNLISNLIRVRVPPEELERRAQASRAAALPGEVESYQRIMLPEWGEGADSLQRLHARAWAMTWEKELDARLALAKSPNTSDDKLFMLSWDDSLEVQRAASETLDSPQVRARQAEKKRAEAERVSLEAQRRSEEGLKRLAVEERVAEQRRLSAAKSTDTPQDLLRSLATSDRSPEVRRAAIETLALLRQAGF